MPCCHDRAESGPACGRPRARKPRLPPADGDARRLPSLRPRRNGAGRVRVRCAEAGDPLHNGVTAVRLRGRRCVPADSARACRAESCFGDPPARRRAAPFRGDRTRFTTPDPRPCATCELDVTRASWAERRWCCASRTYATYAASSRDNGAPRLRAPDALCTRRAPGLLCPTACTASPLWRRRCMTIFDAASSRSSRCTKYEEQSSHGTNSLLPGGCSWRCPCPCPCPWAWLSSDSMLAVLARPTLAGDSSADASLPGAMLPSPAVPSAPAATACCVLRSSADAMATAAAANVAASALSSSAWGYPPRRICDLCHAQRSSVADEATLSKARSHGCRRL